MSLAPYEFCQWTRDWLVQTWQMAYGLKLDVLRLELQYILIDPSVVNKKAI